jgi:hypothetical protein
MTKKIKQSSGVPCLAPPPHMDILKCYHQLLSSTAANGASFTVEIFMSGHQLPSLTIDQNAFLENMVGNTKQNSDRKSKLMELLWAILSSDDKLSPLPRRCIPLPYAPKMQSEVPSIFQCQITEIMHFFLRIMASTESYTKRR